MTDRCPPKFAVLRWDSEIEQWTIWGTRETWDEADELWKRARGKCFDPANIYVVAMQALGGPESDI